MPIHKGIGIRKSGNNNSKSNRQKKVNESHDHKPINPVYGPTGKPTPPPSNPNNGNKSDK